MSASNGRSPVERLARLFTGSNTAHGRFIPRVDEENVVKKGGKVDTVREPTTHEHWNNHVTGIMGLGIIPICDDNSCRWGVIDVDIYPLNIVPLLQKIEELKLPLVCCRSKSGGAHLFLFLEPTATASAVQSYLRGLTATLGIAGVEVFPKQTKILVMRGDVGNWLNMPYFGATRKCVVLTPEGEARELDLLDFLNYAEESRVDLSVSEKHKLDLTGSTLSEAPPCLQTLEIQGFPEGTRNQGLFSLGVYAKRAHPDTWRQKLEDYNRTFFTSPLSTGEMGVIIKSLDRKDYFYRCHEEPISSFCNAQLCRTRKFGISTIANMPIVNSVTKLIGDDVIWFIDVEGGRLELNTEELFDNKRFQKKCMNELNIVPYGMTSVAWTSYLQKLIDQAIIVKQEGVSNLKEQLWDHFTMYVKLRMTRNPLDLEHNKVFYSEEDKEIWFKLRDFIAYLGRKKFGMVRTLVSAYLHEKGLDIKQKRIGAKIIRHHYIKYEANIEVLGDMLKRKETDVQEDVI